MKKYKIRVRIIPIEKLDNELNTRDSFWEYVRSQNESSNYSTKELEGIFKRRFTRELQDGLRSKFQRTLRDTQRNYQVESQSLFLDEYLHRYIRLREKENQTSLDNVVEGIAKLQALKDNYFKENKEYQKLLTKNILAAQIDFGIDSITYSSLGFDLSVEPLNKAAQLFDNNYELFRIFLDQYIPESFLASIDADNSSMPFSVSIESSSEFRNEFEKQLTNTQKVDLHDSNNIQPKSKWDKAKWAWILTNSSLVVPVIFALVVFYFTSNKFESMERFRQENQKELNLERDKLLKSYQELVSFQKSSYQDLIQQLKKDTLQ